MASGTFTRRVREKKAEGKVNAWYDGLYPEGRTKLNLMGRTGWPDQCYWIPGGRPFLIEFKAEGEDPRPKQKYVHDKLRKNGYDIETHHDAAEAIAAIKRRIDLAAAREVAEAVIGRVDRALNGARKAVSALEEASRAEGTRKPDIRRKAAKAPVEAAQVPDKGGAVRARPRGRRVLP